MIHGQYGWVIVTRGRYKGRLGYYDDDEGPDESIVYFENKSGGCDERRVKRSYLRPAPDNVIPIACPTEMIYGDLA